MGQSYKLIVIDRILPQTPYADAHALFVIHIQRYLRPVILLQILNKLLGSTGQLKPLRLTAEASQLFNQLVSARLITEFHKHCRRVAVQHRYPDTLTSNHRRNCRNNDAVLDLSPYPQGFLLAFLLLASDIRNNIAHHFRPIAEGLSCAGDSLVSSGYYLHWFEFLPGGEHRRIALYGAVRLDGHKASFRAQSLLLEIDHLHMLRIDLRNHHGHIRCPSVGTVVGNHRRLGPGIVLFDLLNLFLSHIHSTEHKVNLFRNCFHLVYIHDNNILYCLRHRRRHLPSALHSFPVGSACGAGTGGNRGYFKPGMILQQRNEPLSHHTGSA